MCIRDRSNTEWHNIVVRNKAAEICEKYLKKGDKVYIEGRIKTRKWTDDKGMDRYSTEIQCMDFTFLTPKSEPTSLSGSGGQSGSSMQSPQINNSIAPQNNYSAPSSMPEVEEEDDLPF